MEPTIFSHIADVVSNLKYLWDSCVASDVTEIRAVAESGSVRGELVAPASDGYGKTARSLIMRITILVEKPLPSIAVEPNVVVDRPKGVPRVYAEHVGGGWDAIRPSSEDAKE